MRNSITPFEPRLQDVLEAFEEAMDYRMLQYNAASLARYGFQTENELNRAIGRAMMVCKNLGMNTKKHFRYFYKVDMIHRQTSRDWKLSRLGFYLVLCNGEPSNPYVGSLQMDLLREFLRRRKE